MPGTDTDHSYSVVYDAERAVGLRETVSNGAGPSVHTDYDLDDVINFCEAIGQLGAELRLVRVLLGEMRDIDPQIRQSTVEAVLASHVGGHAAALNALFAKP